MANGNGVEATTKWGGIKLQGPIAIVIFFMMAVIVALLGALLGIIPSPMTQMLGLLEKETAVLTNHTNDARTYRSETLAALEYQNMLMRAICYRLSDTKEQALQCEPGYRGYPEEDLKYYDRPKPKRKIE